MKRLNGIQRLWTWTVTGQYLRALAGVRFPRFGASECDVTSNSSRRVMPPTSSTLSNGCSTNVLDHGAEHSAGDTSTCPELLHGNNGVAECGHFPSNFLLGVSTPGNEQLRRQCGRGSASESRWRATRL